MEEARDQLALAVRAERQRCLALHAQALQGSFVIFLLSLLIYS